MRDYSVNPVGIELNHVKFLYNFCEIPVFQTRLKALLILTSKKKSIVDSWISELVVKYLPAFVFRRIELRYIPLTPSIKEVILGFLNQISS